VLLLFAITAFLAPLDAVFVQPLLDIMADQLAEIKNIDPSSSEFSKLLDIHDYS
jgi:hypothetical protein